MCFAWASYTIIFSEHLEHLLTDCHLQVFSMTREQLIERIADAAGPLGPFLTLEEFHQEEERWLSEASLEWVGVLIEILMNPPEIAAQFPWNENWNYALGEILVRCGQLDVPTFLREVEPFFHDHRARQTLIWVVGDLHRPEALDWLEAILTIDRLTPQEYDELVYACEVVGGPSACRVLRRMRKSVPGEMTSLLRDIESALSIAESSLDPSH